MDDPHDHFVSFVRIVRARDNVTAGKESGDLVNAEWE